MSGDGERVQELSKQLQDAEEALQRAARLEIAGSYTGEIMHEVSNSLEALTNLVFFGKIHSEVPRVIVGHLETAEEQLTRFGEITRKSLSFFRDRAEAMEVNLVELAESALALHASRARQRKVEIRKKIEGRAPEAAPANSCKSSPT